MRRVPETKSFRAVPSGDADPNTRTQFVARVFGLPARAQPALHGAAACRRGQLDATEPRGSRVSRSGCGLACEGKIVDFHGVVCYVDENNVGGYETPDALVAPRSVGARGYDDVGRRF